MTTQQQAYINGFVKRASQYGYSEEQAVGILKRSGFMDNIKKQIADQMDQVESAAYNARVGELQFLGLPHHVADYGMKTMAGDPEALGAQVKNIFTDKYNTDTFNAEHPMLHQAADFLKSHNIDPTHAALAAGGTALLGGGYLLGKHLNKKKQQPEYINNYLGE